MKKYEESLKTYRNNHNAMGMPKKEGRRGGRQEEPDRLQECSSEVESLMK